jgi:hypothetical protein
MLLLSGPLYHWKWSGAVDDVDFGRKLAEERSEKMIMIGRCTQGE